jgi:teichuronic acid exporter
MSLLNRSISAITWSGADALFRQLLQTAISIALARLLSPEEFGTIALLYLFVGVASAFVDSGFSAALVRHQDVTHLDETTVFWFNLALGVLLAAALWAAAPLISGLFELPVLVPLTAIMALNVLISALGSIHITLLTKRLDFRTQMKVGAVATAAAGLVAIAMAWRGYGVWALAAQTLVATSVSTALLWFYSSWRPSAAFSRASARRLFGFGGYLLAAGLLDTFYNRMYTLLIGKYFGVRELGYFSRADGAKQMPVSVLATILTRVSFPAFAAAAEDKAQLRRGVRLALRAMMLLNVPMMLGMAALAEPFVLTLFGVQWLPAVPLLQVLCLGSVFWPLHVINLNVLTAQGHSHLFFRLEVVKKLVGIVLLVVGSFYGVMGIAWSQVVFGLLGFVINAHYTRLHLDYGPLAQVLDFLPMVAIAIPMALVVHWIGAQLELPPVVELLGLSGFGALIFLGLASMFRLTALSDMVALVSSRRTSAP